MGSLLYEMTVVKYFRNAGENNEAPADAEGQLHLFNVSITTFKNLKKNALWRHLATNASIAIE